MCNGLSIYDILCAVIGKYFKIMAPLSKFYPFALAHLSRNRMIQDNIVSNNEPRQKVLTAICLHGVFISFSEGKILFSDLSFRHRIDMTLTKNSQRDTASII